MLNVVAQMDSGCGDKLRRRRPARRDGGVVGAGGGWRDRNELWTDRITSSCMYFRGLKPDTHAIVILNHRLGKPGPRSCRVAVPGGGGGDGGLGWRGECGGGVDKWPWGQVAH